MNIQELVTAAEEGVNVKIVLMNNASLGLVHQQQTCSTASASTLPKFRACPFHQGCRRFGIRAVDLDQAEQPRAALADALIPGPC